MQQNQYNGIITGWFFCSGNHYNNHDGYCYRKLFHIAGNKETIQDLCLEIKCPKCGTINTLNSQYIKRIFDGK